MIEFKGIREQGTEQGTRNSPAQLELWQATVCPLGQQHLYTFCGQPIKPRPTMQDAQCLHPYIPANDSGDRATSTCLAWCEWQLRRDVCHLLSCALSTLSTGSGKLA